MGLAHTRAPTPAGDSDTVSSGLGWRTTGGGGTCTGGGAGSFGGGACSRGMPGTWAGADTGAALTGGFGSTGGFAETADPGVCGRPGGDDAGG